ncbi:MAG: GH3 auxin-responsive promoter family protein [Promethearchaeota archaeon]
MIGILPLLGKLLYGRKVRSFLRGLDRPQEAQEACLKRILTRSQGTVYGRRHKFSDISTPEAYQENIPLTTYDDLKPYYESISKGAENILYPDKTYQFMITSGTTGRQKYIPLSLYSLGENRTINEIVIAKLFSLAKGLDGLRAQSFSFSAPAVIPEYQYGKYKCGYLTGIIGAKGAAQGGLFSRLGRIWPSDEVLNMTDWTEKSYRLALEIIPLDIRIMMGLPSNLCSFFRTLIDDIAQRLMSDPQVSSSIKETIQNAQRRGELDLRRLWPKLHLVVYGGIHIDPYLPFLESYFSPIRSLGVYQATEGYLGLEWYGEGINPSLRTIFLEFIPADNPDARPRLISEVRRDVVYSPLITTSGGFYRYELGDHIIFTKLNPPTIKIIGRAGTVASLVGERLQETQLNNALQAACEATGATIGAFMAVPVVTRKRTAYDIYIEFRREPPDLAEFEARFDDELRKLNHSYNYERRAEVIAPARFITLPPRTLERIPAAKHGVDGAGKVPVIGTLKLVKQLPIPLKIVK